MTDSSGYLSPDEWVRQSSLPYFVPSCSLVLDSFLRKVGFEPGASAFEDEALYRFKKLMLTFSFDPLFAPNYIVGIGIGYRREASMIGLWEAIPPNTKKHDYWNWRFNDKEALINSLARIRDEVLTLYLSELVGDEPKLRKLIENRNERSRKEMRKLETDQIRTNAERAFKASDFRLASTLYAKLNEDELTRVEKKRQEIALKKLKGNKGALE